jgi:hypothetical protein
MKQFLGEILFILMLFTAFVFFAFADGADFSGHATKPPDSRTGGSYKAEAKIESRTVNTGPLLIMTRFD